MAVLKSHVDVASEQALADSAAMPALVAVALVAVAILLVACSPAPSPTVTIVPTAATSPAATGSPAPASITERIGNFAVTHPATWLAVRGPDPIPAGAVPLFYLSNTPLTPPACPTASPGGVFEGCLDPLESLPASGVLVTVTPALGLAEQAPPAVNVDAASGSCQAIGGERSVESVVNGVVVEACLRGPGLDDAEPQVRQLISSLLPEP